MKKILTLITALAMSFVVTIAASIWVHRNDGEISVSREQRIQKIQEWAKDLVDLSRRNRLLYFKHPKSGSLEFEQTASEIIRGLGGSGAREGWGFYLPPPPPPEDEESPPYEPVPPESDELVTAAHLNRFGPDVERSLQNHF